MMLTFADKCNLQYLRLRELLRIRNHKWSLREKDCPKVWYGLSDAELSERCESGGMVKLTDLFRIFPNEENKPNILYLVNSGLPNLNADLMAASAKKAGLKIVLNQNGVAYPGWHGKGWKWANRANRAILKMADYVFYQSYFCKISADRFAGNCLCPYEILYNAVDTDTFLPLGKKRYQKDIVLLLAGSHQHFYRVRSALDTLRVLLGKGVSARLVVAGKYIWRPSEEGARQEAKQYAARKKLTRFVNFRNAYSQEEAVTMFQDADILLHTKYNDPCPRLAVEAMACGVPIVYTASGGMPEIVGEDAGVGVDAPLDWERDHPPKPNQMAEAVLTVMEDIGAFSSRARQRAVEMFDVSSWLVRHSRAFEKLLF